MFQNLFYSKMMPPMGDDEGSDADDTASSTSSKDPELDEPIPNPIVQPDAAATADSHTSTDTQTSTDPGEVPKVDSGLAAAAVADAAKKAKEQGEAAKNKSSKQEDHNAQVAKHHAASAKPKPKPKPEFKSSKPDSDGSLGLSAPNAPKKDLNIPDPGSESDWGKALFAVLSGMGEIKSIHQDLKRQNMEKNFLKDSRKILNNKELTGDQKSEQISSLTNKFFTDAGYSDNQAKDRTAQFMSGYDVRRIIEASGRLSQQQDAGAGANNVFNDPREDAGMVQGGSPPAEDTNRSPGGKRRR